MWVLALYSVRRPVINLASGKPQPDEQVAGQRHHPSALKAAERRHARADSKRRAQSHRRGGKQDAAAGLDPVVAHLFDALVFALGVGYFVAAEDPRGNRGILWAGAIAKIAVFFIVGAHVWAGDAGFAAMRAPIGDAVFAVLFLCILTRPAHR
jgi:hypothetical protein